MPADTTLGDTVMGRGRTLIRLAVMGIATMAIAACAGWIGPESGRRGHIFDEASRRPVALMPDEGGIRLETAVNERFPVGTPLIELARHVVDAGGICARKVGSLAADGADVIICSYESVSFGTFAFLGMGQPSFYESHSSWTLDIRQSDGVIVGYDIAAVTRRTRLSRDDYLERLARQDAAERAR